MYHKELKREIKRIRLIKKITKRSKALLVIFFSPKQDIVILMYNMEKYIIICQNIVYSWEKIYEEVKIIIRFIPSKFIGIEDVFYGRIDDIYRNDVSGFII